MKAVIGTILLTLSLSAAAEQADPFDTTKTADSGQSNQDIAELKREFQMLKREMLLRVQQKEQTGSDPVSGTDIQYKTHEVESFLEAAGKYYVRLTGPASNPRYVELTKEQYLGMKAQYNTITSELDAPVETGGKQ